MMANQVPCTALGPRLSRIFCFLDVTYGIHGEHHRGA
jgi:hypothetical protein|eukprot:COSAG01_NODE_104_length_26171_cov_96.617612_3_plen_37_part_00